MSSRYSKNACHTQAPLPSRIPQLGDDTDLLSDCFQRIGPPQQFTPLVRGAHDRAQSRLPLGHRREPHRRCEHPGLEELLGELEGLGSVSNVDRNNRRLADIELKTAFLKLPLEKLRVRPQLFYKPLALRRIQQSERCLASRRGSRRMRSRKQERPRPQVQEIDQVPRSA